MSKQKNEIEMEFCLVCRLFSDFEKVSGLKPKFFKHLKRTQNEILRDMGVMDD